MKTLLTTILFCFLSFSCVKTHEVDVLIIGGGASGTTAGIQSARLGARTLIIEEHTWLGGMLTAAGVSAIDGNHKLPAGLWGNSGTNWLNIMDMKMNYGQDGLVKYYLNLL
ncbi:MAG: FAD-dependent oxidoreductase [Tannerellaceae bacterium]|nr:FAD-dependent oxidoreductase [Tannerellaceae bacterium]